MSEKAYKFLYLMVALQLVYIFKCDVLAIALLRIKIPPSFLLLSFLPLRQNLDKQINPLKVSKEFHNEFPKNPKKFKTR